MKIENTQKEANTGVNGLFAGKIRRESPENKKYPVEYEKPPSEEGRVSPENDI